MAHRATKVLTSVRRRALISIFAFSLLLPLSLPAQTIKNTLPNGLDVIVRPVPGAPSVAIALVFKGGADAQTAKTAGLFSLLEHVIFRGLAVSPGEPEPAGALEAIDAEILDGGAGRNRLWLAISISPELLGQGIDTLAYLFSEIRLNTAFEDSSVLQEAKDSSIMLAQTLAQDPGRIHEAALEKKLFSTAPWRLDPAGNEAVIREVTVTQLRNHAALWLVPDNAALIISGDVDPATAFERSGIAFSGWKTAPDPMKSPPPAFAKPGVARPTFVVYPDPRMEKGAAMVELRYRGPDASSVRSVQASVWEALASSETGKLAKALQKGMPSWSKPSAPMVRYERTRAASWFSVSAKLAVDPKASFPDAILQYKEIVRGTEMYAMKTNAAYFSQAELAAAKALVGAKSTEAMDAPARIVSLLADAWIDADISLDANWRPKVDAVGVKELAAFADEYFMKNLEVLSVRMNPEDYQARKRGFDNYGFEQIKPETAFWWK